MLKKECVAEVLCRPTRDEAEEAVRTMLAWAGDDPRREGLRETPARVVRAYEEWFGGYTDDAEAYLRKTFSETGGYDDMVLLRGIQVQSHCEHHMAPFIGTASIAYVPNGEVVGLSKLARVVEVYAKRLQTQENLTAQIVHAITNALAPRGVAILIEAEHGCMATRGVHQTGVGTITTRFTGDFKTDPDLRKRFLGLAGPVANP